MCEVVHSSDVVIVRLKYNIWIDIPAGQWEVRMMLKTCDVIFDHIQYHFIVNWQLIGMIWYVMLTRCSTLLSSSRYSACHNVDNNWWKEKSCKQFEHKAWNRSSVCPSPQCVLCRLHFAEPCLMRLEEEAVHIGQLHFVIIKQQQLQQERNKQTHSKIKHICPLVESKKKRRDHFRYIELFLYTIIQFIWYLPFWLHFIMETSHIGALCRYMLTDYSPFIALHRLSTHGQSK